MVSELGSSQPLLMNTPTMSSGSPARASDSLSDTANSTAQATHYSLADSHSLQITPTKLNGANFVEWSQSAMLVIDGKGRLDHITGEAKAPEADTADYKKWRSSNSMVKAWLINSMEPTIGRTHLYHKTAKEIWDAVAETYSDLGNSAQIFELKSCD